MERPNSPRLVRPLVLRPSVEIWLARLGSRTVVVRRYPPRRPGSPWPGPPDPDLLAATNHPALVRFLGCWQDDEGAELHGFARLQGETLADRLSRGILPADRWTDAVATCARGLRWLHERCTAAPRLHGDVSPGNVHLASDGRVRWLDVRADVPGVLPGGPGVILGTLPWLAPEVLSGEPPVEASEVFSLGLVALAAATGALPWARAGSPREVLAAIRQVPPGTLASPLPAPAALLLAAMLDPSPSRRPTASDVVACLR